MALEEGLSGALGELELPQVLTTTPQPLVGLLGINTDTNINHKLLWEAFSSNRGLDRYSLNFVLLDSGSLSLPPGKPARTSYEWYVPRGLLKRNWMVKHLQEIPSVIVVFSYLEFQGNSPNTQAVAARVQEARKALGGRPTKFSIVILQDAPGSSIQDESVLNTICTECTVSSRAVFSLTLGQEDLLPSVMRLESAIQELSQNYYHGQMKGVRGHRELLNRSSHLHLLVRHAFKIGFFNELKSDSHAAYKSYCSAYQLLLEVRLTEGSLPEVRTVAALINWKVCRLAFRLNLPRDAITQFRRHLEHFRTAPSHHQLSWEHAAWQAQQSLAFGLMFRDAARGGQQAVQTQHPGVYFLLAAEYSISRRKLAESLCSQVTSYPQPDPLQGLNSLEYYGQRPWREGKLEPSDLGKEGQGVEALMYRERTRTKHSLMVRALLKLAAEQFEIFSCPRVVTRINIQIAEELMVEGAYSEALSLLSQHAPVYRSERWGGLLSSLLHTSLKCSYLASHLPSYTADSLELVTTQGVTPSEVTRVWANISSILNTGKPPLPEPSLTAKSERASVGAATKAWTQLLEGSFSPEVDVTGRDLALQFSLNIDGSVEVGSEAWIHLLIRNRGESDIGILGLGVAFTNSYYDQFCRHEERLQVPAGQNITVSKSWTPLSGEVGQKVSATGAKLKVGFKQDGYVCLLFGATKPHEPSPLDYFSKPSLQNWECDILPRKAELEFITGHASPALVGEWARISLEITSREVELMENVQLSCWLRDGSDPLIGDTTLLSLEPSGTVPESSDLRGIVTTLSNINSGDSYRLDLFMRVSTLGMRVIFFQLDYCTRDLASQHFQSLELDVSEPFSVSSVILTRGLEETSEVFTSETFCVESLVSCHSVHPLQVERARLEVRPPLTLGQPLQELREMSLRQSSSLSLLFPLLAPQESLLLETQALFCGRLVLEWRRQEEAIINLSEFELPSVKVSRASLHCSAKFPPWSLMRSPTEATFTFLNRTGEVLELHLATDPSDSFMFSGPKQVKLKLFPNESYSLSHMFYPLVCGEVPCPRLRLLGAGVRDLQAAVDRAMPNTLTVLPNKQNLLPSSKANTDPEGAPLASGPACVRHNLSFRKRDSRS